VPLPNLSAAGDLPRGVHQATIEEVISMFGKGTAQRVMLGERLRRIYRLVKGTGKVKRFIVFGSFVTSEPLPKDVDLFLIMEDDFKVSELRSTTRVLFHHLPAQSQFGASIFWVRSASTLGGENAAISIWQLKRDGSQRGIVEVL
jgi:hypothetical protein